ncbi:uncharacterized protein [Temnothorax nylanderi]|uniref:uncharacterized protein n=1 Tax=Temnothorax nylanderi TaxID=102681 RepID=UPI003A8B4152
MTPAGITRELYIFLKTCNIPFEKKIVNLNNLEQYTPEYEQINPFKKIPVIEHDSFKLAKCVGITRYVCREFKVDDHWYPSDSKKQAKVDEYLEWQYLNTRLHCAAYFCYKCYMQTADCKFLDGEKLMYSQSTIGKRNNEMENDCEESLDAVCKDVENMSESTVNIKIKKGMNWSEKETNYFIQLCIDKRILKLIDGEKYKHIDVYKSLESNMKQAGFVKSGIQIKLKMKHLKEMYYKCKRNKIQSVGMIVCHFNISKQWMNYLVVDHRFKQLMVLVSNLQVPQKLRKLKL